ncbi:putative membrane protein [Curtobacterium flaccumfaciens]|uniref:Membrane protein n=1 Tax=Curtobacterium salicis TaxID=1779862 RepID=A0ABX0T5X1_9MICO|nr:putative membrane protein [Curtobacterium sp. WW7]
MNTTVVGMAVGAVLAIVALTLGFWAFVVVAVAIALGGLIGRIVSGDVDLRRLLDVLRGRRSSS